MYFIKRSKAISFEWNSCYIVFLDELRDINDFTPLTGMRRKVVRSIAFMHILCHINNFTCKVAGEVRLDYQLYLDIYDRLFLALGFAYLYDGNLFSRYEYKCIDIK